jgi:hypothetical protein
MSTRCPFLNITGKGEMKAPQEKFILSPGYVVGAKKERNITIYWGICQVTRVWLRRLTYVPVSYRCLTNRTINMYTLKSKVIATGVIAFTLLAASPVFADSNTGSGIGLRLGVFTRFLQDERKAEQEQRKEAREERKEDRKELRHATSSTASTTKLSVNGTITFVSGSTLTVQGNKGAVYTVNASGAAITGYEGRTLTLAALAVNDKVEVKGTLVNNVVVATKIKDKSDRTGKVFRHVQIGTVTAINGSTVTLSNFGSQGSTVVNTNSATTYKVNGAATSSSALTVGSHVWVYGTSTATSTASFNASLVVIVTEGLNWIKHLWK